MQNDIAGVYLAGALIFCTRQRRERLIDNYKIGPPKDGSPRRTIGRGDCPTIFFQPLGTDSQYIAVLAREFPARLRKISARPIETF